jgi:hypothetical protein
MTPAFPPSPSKWGEGNWPCQPAHGFLIRLLRLFASPHNSAALSASIFNRAVAGCYAVFPYPARIDFSSRRCTGQSFYPELRKYCALMPHCGRNRRFTVRNFAQNQ